MVTVAGIGSLPVGQAVEYRKTCPVRAEAPIPLPLPGDAEWAPYPFENHDRDSADPVSIP